VAKRRKRIWRNDDPEEVVRLEPQPDLELQRQWQGLFVPYIYCPGCRHTYSPDELNRFDRDDPLPLPALNDEGKPDGAQDLEIACTRCRRARLVRVLVDFGAVEPYRIGIRAASDMGDTHYLCTCPLCGGLCQVRRSAGLRAGEDWYCQVCHMSLQRRWS
jgi:hypothetical protein